MEMTAISPSTPVAPHPVMFLKRLLLTTVLLGAAGQLNSAAHAQMDQMASRRAINMARDTAIRLNGGLSMYRPGSCMFKTAKNNPCLVQSDASGFVSTSQEVVLAGRRWVYPPASTQFCASLLMGAP